MNSRVLLATALSGAVLVGFGLETTQIAGAAPPAGPAAGKMIATRSAPVLANGGLSDEVGRALRVGASLGGPVNTEGLLPRRMVRKPGKERFFLPSDPVTGEAWYTGNIVLKFKDEFRARAPRSDSPFVASLAGGNVSEFSDILAASGLRVRQWINRTPEQLAALETRARNHSNRAQPDLAGMMIIENVDPKQLVDVAWQINALPEVEFAVIERIAQLHQCGPEGPGPCNVPGPSCDAQGFNCNPDPGNQIPAAEFGCQDASCCEMIADLLPYCNDQDSPAGWDIICAAYANLMCNGTVFDNVNPTLQDRYNPCFTDPADPTMVNPLFEPVVGAVQQGGCFEEHTGRGCSQPSCCFAVCTVDPACCNAEWDQNCVLLATSEALAGPCSANPSPNPTPSFLPFASTTNPGLVDGYQLYLQSRPTDPTGEFPQAGFFSGRGLDIAGFNDVYQQVATNYLGGVTPNFFGKGINVAIIEFAAYVNHEDFVLADQEPPALLLQPKVIAEPGQTIVLIDGANNAPMHGTAALGQVISADNGFGVTGIAHEAQGYFFPIVSVEEGNRPQNAIISCFETFVAGDVVNHSWGSPPDFPLPSIEQYYVLFGFGSDLGITTVCSAGNSNCPIQPQPGEIDCEAFVVGASTAGRYIRLTGCPGYAAAGSGTAAGGAFLRMPFSNYSGEDGLSDVHVCAWGDSVTTTGYGDLFTGANGLPPNDPDSAQLNRLRMYTSSFNGTSSAAPIITGTVALVQAMAKQVYGIPLAPGVVRGILSGYGDEQSQVSVSPEDCGNSVPDCCIIGDPDCESVFKNIGIFPRLRDSAVAIFTGTPWDGNRADVEVVTGTPSLGGPPWSSFLIRASDDQRLRINALYRTAGQTQRGLTYLTTGFTTDMIARLQLQLDDPATQLENLGLTVEARASRNFVMLGAFIKNFESGDYEFFGANFLGTGDGQLNFEVPNFGSNSAYVNPANNNVEFRLWTVGLGATRAYEAAYDLVQIRVNNPFNPL